MPTTGEIIKDIKTAIKKKDISSVGESILELIEQEPDRWFLLLRIDNIIPDPYTREFSETTRYVIGGLAAALQSDTSIVKHFIDLLHPLLQLRKIFSSISQELENLSVWDEPGITLVQRFAAFVEDQANKNSQKVENALQRQGYSTPDVLLNDNLTTEMGGVNTNLLTHYESVCENFQLTLAYCLYRYKDNYYGEITSYKSPYGDNDFRLLFTLANVWRAYKGLWENIKYLDWTSSILSEEEEIFLFYPKDLDEYLRSEIGKFRKQEIQYEFGAALIPANSLVIYSDSDDVIKELAKSIIIPSVGQIWDGVINEHRLIDALIQTREDVFGKTYLDHHHYTSLLEDCLLGESSNKVNWETYWKIIIALKLLARIFLVSIQEQVDTEKSQNDVLRKAILIDKTHLARLLSLILGLGIQDCETTLDVLIFKPRLVHLEIWDTPLINFNEDCLLFVPTLVKNGSPERAAENFIAQWNEDLFAKRGKELETEIYGFLEKIEGVRVLSSISFEGISGELLECDVVAHWDGYLFFVETKCTKSVYSGADSYRAKKRVEEAINQLNVRKEACLTNWDVFSSALDDLNLPEKPLPYERICLIAVTNILEFTTWNTRDVIVTDEYCFRRFFGPANVEIFGDHKSLGVLDRIRLSEEPTATELIKYLKKPPQVERVRKSLNSTSISLPIIGDSGPKIGMAHFTYNPKKDKRVSRILDKKSKTKRSRRRSSKKGN